MLLNPFTLYSIIYTHIMWPIMYTHYDPYTQFLFYSMVTLEPHAIQNYIHIPSTHMLQLGLQLILAVQIYFKLHGCYRNRSFLSLLEMY